jgi:hypothetical protein
MEIQTINLSNNKKFKYLYADYKNGKDYLYFMGYSPKDSKYMIKDNEKAFYYNSMKYWVIKEIA